MVLRASHQNIIDNLHREFPDTREMDDIFLLNEYFDFKESNCPTFPEWLGWTNSAVDSANPATPKGNI
jgi:hypothetical protein